MKTGNILRRVAAFGLALALCVTATDTGVFAKEKAKPAISDAKLAMDTNENYCISLDRASAKVTWKSSDSKLVKIEKAFGKYGQEVSLVTGNRTGSCTIKAKMKNKTYYCKVTVKKGDIIKKYSGRKSKTVLEKVTQTKKSIAIRYKMCAAAHKGCKCPQASYSSAIQLEKYTAGKWREVPMDVGIVFTCASLCIIKPKTSVSKTVRLENYYDISKLTAGSYRLNVNVRYPHVKSPYVKFTLK